VSVPLLDKAAYLLLELRHDVTYVPSRQVLSVTGALGARALGPQSEGLCSALLLGPLPCLGPNRASPQTRLSATGVWGTGVGRIPRCFGAVPGQGTSMFHVKRHRVNSDCQPVGSSQPWVDGPVQAFRMEDKMLTTQALGAQTDRTL
jgi:hypothetical protein